MIGYFLAVSLVVKGVGVLLGMPIMTRVFKLSDTTIVCAGIITNITSTVFMAFTTNAWQAFLGKLNNREGFIHHVHSQKHHRLDASCGFYQPVASCQQVVSSFLTSSSCIKSVKI